MKSEAIRLSKRLKDLESSILLELWNIILERMNKTSKTLQTERLPFNNAVHLLKSLWGFVDSQCDRFDEFEKLRIELSGTSIYRNDQL